MKNRYHSVNHQHPETHITHKKSLDIQRHHQELKVLTYSSSQQYRHINSPQPTQETPIYNLNIINNISHSHELKSASQKVKDCELFQQKSSGCLKLRKMQSVQERQRRLVNENRSRVIQFLNKKSLQQLKVSSKNIYKTQYSKLNRKKTDQKKMLKIDDEERLYYNKNETNTNKQPSFIHINNKEITNSNKETIHYGINQSNKQSFKQNNNKSSNIQSNKELRTIFQPFLQERLIQKYKELKQINNKSNPFNLINHLYQIDVFSAKKLDILANNPKPKQQNNKQHPHTLQAKIFKMISKPPECHQIKHLFIQQQSYQELNDIQTIQPDDNKQEIIFKIKIKPKDIYRINKKVSMDLRTEQTIQYKDINSKRGEREQVLAKKLSSNASVQRMQQRQREKERQRQREKEKERQRQTILPPPKNLQSNTYVIYEVLNPIKLKSPTKLIFEPLKKKQFPGKVHLSSNMKMTSQIASLTKIMTCIVVIQICEKLRINAHIQKYKIGIFETLIGGTSAQINFGEIYTINQLLHGLMLPSGNDASLALARWGGNVLLLNQLQGSRKNIVERAENSQIFDWSTQNKFIRCKNDKLKPIRCYNRFLAEMNKKARLLGLLKTSFANSHGLSNPLNKSTCLDIALLCEYSMKNQYFRTIVGCKQFKTIIQKQLIMNEQPKPKGNKGIDPQYVNLGQNIVDKNILNQNEEDQDDEEEEQQQLQLLKRSEYIKQEVWWVNTHKLVHEKQEYIGIKTGVTATAGPCLASYLKILDRNFIIVVLNSKKLSSRFSDTQMLKKWLLQKERLIHEQQRQQVANIQ